MHAFKSNLSKEVKNGIEILETPSVFELMEQTVEILF